VKSQKPLTVFMVWSCLASQLQAQEPSLLVERPKAPVLIRPYMRATIPPVRLNNSNRLHSLIRAGKLYLTVQDAIALAIENNLDLEVDRYGPVVADWTLERRQGGGALPGVTGGNNLVNQAANGQGVQGSQVAAGLANNNNGNNGGGGNAIIAQIGPVTPVLDPVLQNLSFFSHVTTPQPNTVQSQTPTLIDTKHVFNTFVQQGLLTGGYVQIAGNESYLKQNAPTDILNPSVAPVAQIFVRQFLLNGFGTNVNSRFIRVAEKNVGLARETFRSQLLNLVATVLNLYWDLVTDNDDLRARQRTLAIVEKFASDTKRQIELSAIARFELYRAEAELATRRQEVAISQAAVRQQENLLKNALSRNGLQDPLLDAAEVVPVDQIQVPEQDDLPPLRELVNRALAKRPDIAMAKINKENADISAIGTANGVLPTLRTDLVTFNSGLSGVANPQPGGFTADPYYVGGLGNGLGQIFRRNFPSQRAAVSLFGTAGNRIHQGDYGIDQLQLRQTELITYRSMNQVVVDVSNQLVGLRQARSRHSQAVATRTLQEQLLEKEQRSFALGGSNINNVVAVQRSLAAAQTTEITARSLYSRARVSLDQVLGETLEKNNVSVDEALKGRVARVSHPPSP
jgi:outer membrane protein